MPVLRSGRKFEPAYLKLYESGELRGRVERAVESLRACEVCPRNCRLDRWPNKFAVCKTCRQAIASSYAPAHREESCLRCWRGQNFDISGLVRGTATPPERLAGMMVELQDWGCHNINFVTPEHVVPQIVEALPLAIERGLRLPLVYNTSAYDSLESLRLMDGVVDIYMPDFKYWDSEMARRYSRAPDYPEVARRNLKEMHRQVGALTFDANGLAQRGLLLRHLVMPGDIVGTREIMCWVASELSPDTYVNLMAQYFPAGKVSRREYSEINRPILPSEYERALDEAWRAGLTRLDSR